MAANFSESAFPGAPVRAGQLQYMVNCIRQGQCCSIVGPSNTGKSFLLKSLTTEEVRQSCTRSGLKPPITIFVDCLEAGGTEQAFYELLLRRTIEDFEQAGTTATTLEDLRNLHREVLTSTVDFAIRSLYARSVRLFEQEQDLNVLLILDEFDDIFRHLPPWPFRQLRALYDALGAKLLYVTGTSYHLEQLRSDAETYEFRELFHVHTLILRPLIEEDAQRMLVYLADRQGRVVSPQNMALMIELSGGHPGLLERIYTMLSANEADLTAPLDIAAVDLGQQRPIQKECARLWSELEAEQDGLRRLVQRGTEALDLDQRQALEVKGLVVSSGGEELTIFSPVFRTFVEQEVTAHLETVPRGLRCDFETGQIWVDGQEVTLQLSEPQRKLVTFLYEKAGGVCTYDEIAVGVWGIGEGVSPGAIYELVKRVRQKIEPDWKKPRYIVTVPGKGYRLEASD